MLGIPKDQLLRNDDQFRMILKDLEMAEVDALTQAFPRTQLQGCFFHLVPSTVIWTSICQFIVSLHCSSCPGMAHHLC